MTLLLPTIEKMKMYSNFVFLQLTLGLNLHLDINDFGIQ